MSPDDVMSAFRRTEQALGEQLASWESLGFGVAYCAPALPALPDANQLRDVWLADISAEAAYERAEAYFSGRGLVCRRWTPAAGQPVEAVEPLLRGKGWTRRAWTALVAVDLSLAEAEPDPTIRILPARAMRKAYQRTFEDDPRVETMGVERLNDSRYDAVVALRDGEPAARAAYLEVGDVARVADVYVRPRFRRRGAGRALLGHLLRTARRLLPRVLVAGADADDAIGLAFLQRCGFVPGGTLVAFDRPSS